MMRPLLTMTGYDMLQRLRDGSVIIFGLVVPLALITVFHFVFGGVTEMDDLDPVTVAISVPDGDQLGAVLPQALGGIDAVDISLTETTAATVPTLVDDGDADLGIVVPDGFSSAVMAGEGPTVTLVRGDGAGMSGEIVRSVVQGVLTQVTAGAQAATAAIALGTSPADVGQVAQQSATQAPAIELVPGQASDEQLDADASLVAGQTGMFLLFTVGFGVLGLVSEREFGTLARLTSMPMRSGLIIGAKALSSVVLGLVSTTVLLSAGWLVFGADFGSPLAVAVLVVCVVLATTSVMFVIGRVAKTAEQAGIAQSIVAVVLGMAGGAFFPLTATGVLGQVLQVNPVAAFTRGLGITHGGGGVGDLGPPVLTLLVFAVVCLGLARVLPDRGTAL